MNQLPLKPLPACRTVACQELSTPQTGATVLALHACRMEGARVDRERHRKSFAVLGLVGDVDEEGEDGGVALHEPHHAVQR